MKDFGPGFPEWTELGQDGGLDPLGMQRPIEAIYQSLLPGISTITLRFRYYSFFVWMLEVYAREQGNTDPFAFRAFQRRCETLFALIAARGSTELGVAGIDWAQKQLGDVPNDPETIIDFSVGADPDTDVGQRYLRNKGGAFGGIYATQMFEMGLITLGDDRNPIAVCTNRALPLAEAFAAEIGELGTAFLRCVTAGTVTLADLDRMAPMQPSEIVAGSAEHRLLVQVLLGQVSPSIAPDKLRRSTAIMLLQLIGATKEVPRAEAVKWEWFSAGHPAAEPAPAIEDVRVMWALYQACDLMRLAYENILDLALDILQEAELGRMPLGEVVTELVGLVDVPGGKTWQGYSAKDRGVLTRSHYLWKHEPCFMGWRRPNRPPKVAEQTLPSTWEMPSFAKDDRPDHPTPKPLDAFGIPMRQHVARGGLCYEPFSGSGSQIMAGEANGRRVFAMEISPAYVDVAVERWQAETGKDAILDGDGRTFAQVRTERLGDDAEAPADAPATDAAPEPARKRKTAA